MRGGCGWFAGALVAGALLLVAGDGSGVLPRGGPGGGAAEGPAAKKDDCEQVVRQGFPAAAADPANLEASDSAWVIEWDVTNPDNGPAHAVTPSSVLAIRSAKFMYKDRSGQPRWITVLRDLELSEVHLPYAGGSSFYDIGVSPHYLLPAGDGFLGPACVTPGAVLCSPDVRKDRKVLKEVHDDGVRWIDPQGRVRRGEKMILWAVLSGSNYHHVMEYGFRDDGVITCRMGATGSNVGDLDPDGLDVHLHTACWRFDPVLGDPANGGVNRNRVFLVRRLKGLGNFFSVQVEGFPQGEDPSVEGKARWEPGEFTALRVQSTVRTNGHGRPTAYDLVPVRAGAVREFSGHEFAKHDFWVTRADPGELNYVDVPTYVDIGHPVDELPVTVWYISPMLHVPRAEDFDPADGASCSGGLAVAAWAEFHLRPRNLFDGTPFYQPPP